jgi:hypothetical protein
MTASRRCGFTALENPAGSGVDAKSTEWNVYPPSPTNIRIAVIAAKILWKKNQQTVCGGIDARQIAYSLRFHQGLDDSHIVRMMATSLALGSSD